MPMIHHYRRLAPSLILVGLVTLGGAGCAASPESNKAMKQENPVSFPAPEDAWHEQGSFPNMENLRVLREGMSKDQVYGLLGRPHFDEGMFGEHEWNYLFHLADGNGDYRICQYQLHFDDDMLVDGRYWREGQCARLLSPSEPAVMEVSINVDALFNFDSAALTPRGKQRIDELASRIHREIDSPSLSVVGHADRLGDANYNQTLSDRRAMAVRRALIDQGLSERKISSWGVGESDPIKQCSDSLSVQEQRKCLAPNRRVDVEVTGTTIASK